MSGTLVSLYVERDDPKLSDTFPRYLSGILDLGSMDDISEEIYQKMFSYTEDVKDLQNVVMRLSYRPEPEKDKVCHSVTAFSRKFITQAHSVAVKQGIKNTISHFFRISGQVRGDYFDQDFTKFFSGGF